MMIDYFMNSIRDFKGDATIQRKSMEMRVITVQPEWQREASIPQMS